MFSKLLCIVNIRCYKVDQLKLHRSLILGVKGGGGQKQPSPQHLTVTLKCNIFFQNLVKSTTSSTNTLEKCT